jgi:hypothetical protein
LVEIKISKRNPLSFDDFARMFEVHPQIKGYGWMDFNIAKSSKTRGSI